MKLKTLYLFKQSFLWLLAGSLPLQAANLPPEVQGNPLVPDTVADPSIVCFDGIYYLYATTDMGNGTGLPVVWKSKDFLNWSFDGNLIPDVNWKEANYWAPGKVIKVNSRYVLFFTVFPHGYVATADRPEGPFRMVGGPPVFQGKGPPRPNALKPVVPDIDAEPFVDDDGTAYLFWRLRKASKLSPDGLSRTGPVITIPTKRSGYSEGAFLFKRNGIYYYVYTLSGNANYKNAYMMSKTGPLGPFEAPPADDLITFSDLDAKILGPGHGNVIKIPGTDDFVFVYLEYGQGGNARQVYVDRLSFNADGSIQPLHLTHRGVGPVGNAPQPVNLALRGTATASSELKPWNSTITVQTDHNFPLQPPVKGLAPRDKKFGPTKNISLLRTFSPGNAMDGSNGTCWRANDDDAKPWWQIDLGNSQVIKRVEMAFFTPTLGHAWTLEKSTDGQKWEICGEQKTPAIRSPHIVENIGAARFLRVNTQAGSPGLWEFKIF